MDKKSVAKNYRFLAILLSCMVAGALLGWFRPKWGHSIAFLGTVFINMMFCVVVPLVFASIAGSVANMESRQRAGKIMGVTVGTFVITGAIAAVLMFVLMKLFPPVLTPWAHFRHHRCHRRCAYVRADEAVPPGADPLGRYGG